MSDSSKAIQELQKDVCQVITNIGGKIRWTKEFGWLARMNYRLSGREPVLNIEALFLGEKFGVILGKTPPLTDQRITASKYRIIMAHRLEDFTRQFDALKEEKLRR